MISEMKCPHCKKNINVGSLIRSVNSPAQREAARLNGAKGGRPRKDNPTLKPRKEK